MDELHSDDRRFCTACGVEIVWQKMLDCHFATKHRCDRCGSDFYRNPGVNVACLMASDDSSDIGFAGGALAAFETVEEAACRLASYPQVRLTSEYSSLALFAIISDLDADLVHLVFRLRVTTIGANTQAHRQGYHWMKHLEHELRIELDRNQHYMHTGTVRDGQLRWVQECP